MKLRNLLLMLSIVGGIKCNAQSTVLRSAYNQVVSTLREYKFMSEDVHDARMDDARSKSITIRLQGGNLIITFNDTFGHFNDPFFGHRAGIKTIKVAIDEIEFNQPSWEKEYFSIGADDGIEFTYKGQKEILKEYKIYGTELTIKRLLKELRDLQEIADEEEFDGTLGGNIATTKKTTPQTNSTQRKKTNTSTQTQQKQRKRVPTGI